MTKDKVQVYFEEVLTKLWPQWKVNTYQIMTWMKYLVTLDYEAARLAAQEHFVSPEGGYGRPKLHAIVELAKKYQPKRQITIEKKQDYVPSVFVQCVGHKDLIKLYQFFPIYVAREKQNDRDYILRAAESTRRKVEDLYCGSWIIVQNTSSGFMQSMLIDFRCGIEFKEYKEQLAEQCKPKRYEFIPEPQAVGQGNNGYPL